MKRLTLLLGALLLTAAALAQTAVPPTVRIAHGPYVLNVTEDGFTVVWDAKADAIGWVELAPMTERTSMPSNAPNTTTRTSDGGVWANCTGCASADSNRAKPTATASCSGESS